MSRGAGRCASKCIMHDIAHLPRIFKHMCLLVPAYKSLLKITISYFIIGT